MRRLIASVRLSRDTDTTNSPATQRIDIEDWVAEHPGNRIDYWTEDRDVSGGIPMADRPGIGPFLAEDRLGDWDGIIGYRLDRLFRSQLDFLLWVRDIGDAHSKVIIDVEDGTDTSTPAGKRILNSRAEAADYERQRMSERRGKAAKRIRQQARYGGGLIPFGLRRVRTEGGWTLEEHRPYADEAKKIAARILAGESANSIAEDLNVRHIPTSRDAQRILEGHEARDAKWTAANLLRYLRSETLKGYVLNYPKKGQTGEATIVYGDDGLPVRRAAILDDETWDELQEVIKAVGKGRNTGRRANITTLLLGVAFCGECGGRLHSETKIKRGVRIEYYGCQNIHYRGCEARLIPRFHLDDIVSAAILGIADTPVIEIKRGHGNERERKLRDVGQAIINLNEDRYMRGIERPDFDEMLESLQAEHARLRTMPPEPSHEEPMPTGETIGELWQRCDMQGRRAFLQDTGLKLFVTRDASGELHLRIEKGERPKYVTIPLNLPEA